MSEGAFEAKNYALRKSKDGVIVSFVVHPNDVTPELLNLPVGAQLMIGWKEFDDRRADLEGSASEATTGSTPTGPASPNKPKRKFSELSLPEQAGIRCEDGAFWDFLRQRCGEYWNVVVRRSNNGTAYSNVAAEIVRSICAVNSRSELSTNHDAANKWRELETGFQQYLTDHQYADSVRR